MNMIKRIGEVKNGRELLKKFATDNKFIKSMNYESFCTLWQICSKDSKDKMLTYTIYNSIYVINSHDTKIAHLQPLLSRLQGVKYNFEFSCFRDDTNKQILMFVGSEDRKSKGFCFAISLDSLDFDCCFGYKNDHASRLVGLKEIRSRIYTSIIKIQQKYLPNEIGITIDNYDYIVTPPNDMLMNNLITLVKPKDGKEGSSRISSILTAIS